MSQFWPDDIKMAPGDVNSKFLGAEIPRSLSFYSYAPKPSHPVDLALYPYLKILAHNKLSCFSFPARAQAGPSYLAISLVLLIIAAVDLVDLVCLCLLMNVFILST